MNLVPVSIIYYIYIVLYILYIIQTEDVDADHDGSASSGLLVDVARRECFMWGCMLPLGVFIRWAHLSPWTCGPACSPALCWPEYSWGNTKTQSLQSMTLTGLRPRCYKDRQSRSPRGREAASSDVERQPIGVSLFRAAELLLRIYTGKVTAGTTTTSIKTLICVSTQVHHLTWRNILTLLY